MKRPLVILVYLALLFSGCGTTQIVCNNANAKIYVNNRMEGYGSAKITRMGPPKKIHIEVRYNGESIGSLEVKRKFDMATCCIGYFTDGIGLIFAWRFPETVIVPVKNFNDHAPEGSIWNLPPGNRGGIWDKP